MKIRSISIFLLLILFSNSSFSQINLDTLDDSNRISIQSYIPLQIEGLTPIIESQLKNMLNQIIVKNGFGNNSADNRFILTPHIDILSKEITSTAPSMHVFTLQVTLYIADGIDGTLFSSYTKTMKGVGQNETKAYISALGNMKNLDADYTEFIEKGKNKILDYYNSRCQFILSEANSKAEKREFDEAMASLVAIPSVCKNCYAKALDLSVDIFKKKLDFSCDQSMTQAKAAIAQNKWEEAADFISLYTPDVSCYPEVLKILTEITNHQCAIQLGGAKGAWATRDTEAAAEFLSKIPTDSDCAADAKIMIQNISANLDAIEKKKWDLSYEKYNRSQVLNETKVKSDIDLKKREMSFKEKQLYDLKKRQIQSAKEVGLTFARNKSKNMIYNLRDWWK